MKADAIIAVLARLEDWERLREAIAWKLEHLAVLVGWWAANVRDPNRPKTVSVVKQFSADDAHQLTGFTKMQVSRIRGRLKDLDGYAQKWNGHGAEKNEIKSAQMFCEIQLGQLLGPNPGVQAGPGRGHNKNDPHADCFGPPPQRIQDFRRYYGWRNSLDDDCPHADGLPRQRVKDFRRYHGWRDASIR